MIWTENQMKTFREDGCVHQSHNNNDATAKNELVIDHKGKQKGNSVETEQGDWGISGTKFIAVAKNKALDSIQWA